MAGAGAWLRRCACLVLPLWLAACGTDPEQARLCRSLIAAFEADARDLEILPAGEEKVLVMVRFDAIAKQTGRPIELRIAELYTIKDGKIVQEEFLYQMG